MSDYLQITLDVFDEVGQRILVRKTLTVRQFVDEILHAFPDLEQRPYAYALYLQGQESSLQRDVTLHQQGIVAGDHLVFSWTGAAPVHGRRVITGRQQATLCEEESGTVFTIDWQPAVIGRPDADPEHTKLLAVNLEKFPNGQRVSRQHAQITEQNGRYYLESLSPHNTTSINSQPIEPGEKHHLNSSDTIHLDRSGIALTFFTEGALP